LKKPLDFARGDKSKSIKQEYGRGTPMKSSY